VGKPERVAFIAGDITEPDNAQIIVDAALKRFGRLDVLVNMQASSTTSRSLTTP
jgi:NAD(P)-dependent dehydrogenase (short-subunit alcohol dehydrogenase family)